MPDDKNLLDKIYSDIPTEDSDDNIEFEDVKNREIEDFNIDDNIENTEIDDVEIENDFKNENGIIYTVDDTDGTDDYDTDDDGTEQSPPCKRRFPTIILPRWVNFLLFILVLVSAFYAGQYIKDKVFTLAIVSQTSMHDTFTDGDRLYIYRLGKADQFDIVVFQEDEISESWLVKRVVATAGMEVEIKDGLLYITENGVTKVYREEYVNGENITLEKTVVPEGKLFVLGDNRSVSRDSEEFGCVDVESVIGTVVFVNSEEAVLIETIVE